MHSIGGQINRLILLILLIVLGVASASKANNEEKSPPDDSLSTPQSGSTLTSRKHKDPTGALLRSMVVPGWGQAYTGNWIKAALYFGADMGLLYGVYYQNKQYHDSLDRTRFQKTEERRLALEDAADFYRDDRNRLIWWTAGLTLLSMFDAFVEGHLYEFSIDPSLDVKETDGSLTVSIGIQIPIR